MQDRLRCCATTLNMSILFSLLLLACGPAEPATSADATDSLPATDNETTRPAPGVEPTGPVLESVGEMSYALLPDFPELVEGCSCALRPDDVTDQRQYLLAYGYDGPAVIRLNGEEVVFAGAPEETPVSVAEDALQHRFTNERYTLEIRLDNEGRSGDEVWDHSGTVAITDQQTGARRTVRVIGECGC